MLPTRSLVTPTVGGTLHQSSDHDVFQLPFITRQLNTDDIGIIYGLKKDRLGKLDHVFSELQQMDEVSPDLVTVVDILFKYHHETMYRNYLMDTIVLSMAEVNQCNNRTDFDKALEALLGTNFDAVWHSRFHNSVQHVLRANGISCFARRKRRRMRRKCKYSHNSRRALEVQEQIHGVNFLKSVDDPVTIGFEPGLLDMRVITNGNVYIDGQGQITPISKRSSSPIPPPIRRVTHRACGFAPICIDTVDVYAIGGECTKFSTNDALSTTGDLRFAIASKHGVSRSNVRLFCGESEVDDNTAIMAESVSVVFQQQPDSVAAIQFSTFV